MPIRIEAVEPSDGLTYYLSLPQWVEWHSQGPAALASVISLLGGPAAASPPMSPPVVVAGQGAVIRIHRPSRGSYAARKIAILIDGQKVGEVANAATAEFAVAPGKRDVSARVDYVKSKPFSVDVVSGRPRELELVVPELGDLGGQVAGLLGQSNFFTWKIIE